MIGVKKINSRPVNMVQVDGKLYFANEPGINGSVYPAIPYVPGDVILAVWPEVVTGCDNDAVVSIGHSGDADYWGAGLVVDTVGHVGMTKTSTFTLDPTEIPDKFSETWEFEMLGVRKGDHITITTSGELADLVPYGEVVNNDFIRMTLINNTGGEVDIPSQTITVDANKAPLAGSPFIPTTGGAINVTAGSTITTGVLKVSALIARK